LASRFIKMMKRVGKAVVLRKPVGEVAEYGEAGGYDWVDLMVVAELQDIARTREGRQLLEAGVVDFQDKVGFFPAWVPVAADDRVILNSEYVVDSVDKKQIMDETVYLQAVLKRAADTVSADFYGPNRVFFDDFSGGSGNWTVKSGSWSIVNGKYVGEAADAYSVAFSYGG